jgi:glycosyltransferase involved in cell wall biosynthesis
MIEHQVNGYLAPIGNDEELAKGMRWIMDRKKAGSNIGLKCRETALCRYNLHLQAKKHQELYETILKKSHN